MDAEQGQAWHRAHQYQQVRTAASADHPRVHPGIAGQPQQSRPRRRMHDRSARITGYRRKGAVEVQEQRDRWSLAEPVRYRGPVAKELGYHPRVSSVGCGVSSRVFGWRRFRPGRTGPRRSRLLHSQGCQL